ncbi:MAG: nucleoside phosphatase [Desulfobacterales bacterium]|nr:nucleoside phosphatase [Desulfobacterales bacterium]
MMKKKSAKIVGILVLMFWVGAGGGVVYGKSPCHILYDAGSSGTRLHIYEMRDGDWVDHEGPKAGALADPVREIRGKSWADADAVVEEVAGLLEKIKSNGPDDGGKPQWDAFDWSERCAAASANVYATAGMRIAEQEKPLKSAALWAKLEKRLAGELGKDAAIDVRTITGFEEGLYAWLSVKKNRGGDAGFGIVEMGGASSQTTFPCVECPGARNITLAGGGLRIFSYSFLGLGGDEAYKLFGENNPACRFGAGMNDPGWTPGACASGIHLKNRDGMIDPYNRVFGNQEVRVKPPGGMAAIPQWVLTGGFTYTKKENLDNRCRGVEKCYNEETACFRAIYYPKYLKELGVAAGEKSDSSWTLGAVICKETDCLGDGRTFSCHWRAGGRCLRTP